MRCLYLKVVLVFVVCVLLGVAVVLWVDRDEIDEHKREALTAGRVHAHLLEQQLVRSLSATYALAAVLRQGKGNVEDFEELAEQMLAMYGGLSALQLAPNGIIQQIVPGAGHEAAIGHDLLDDPERSKEAFLALKSRALTLAGPFELRQGGQAVVGRLPVFLDVGKRQERFWGFVTAVIRIPDLLRASALTGDGAQGHDFVLTRVRHGSDELQVIWQSTPNPLIDPVSIHINVPNGVWTLSVVRSGGWHMPTMTLVGLVLGVLGACVLAAMLAYHLLRRPLLLAQEVERQTAALNEANDSLQTEIFQHWQTELALRESERALELRVQARTAELESANEALQGERAVQQHLIDTLADTRSQLMQSRMMAAVGQLAAGVAHEINNPLAFIVSNVSVMQSHVDALLNGLDEQSQLLPEHLADRPELLARLRDIEAKMELDSIREDLPPLFKDSLDGLSRIWRIVQDLRELSCVDRSDWQAADINRCLEDTLAFMSNDFADRIEVSCDFGKLPLLMCHVPQISQVFRSVLLNAVEAIDGVGKIGIATRVAESFVEISISDSGHGISPDNLERIFDPFFSTRDVGRGMGLGLAMAYQVMKRHDGDITVTSESGKGAVFLLSLPIGFEEPAAKA